MHLDHSKLIAYAIFGAIFLAILAFRLRRAMKSRPFNLKFIWVLPAIFVALSVMTLTALPPSGAEWLWIVLSLAVGCAIGWFNGRTITLSVDPASGAVTAKATPLAMLFIVGLVVIRYAMRAMMSAEATTYHLSPALIQNAFMALALGLFLTRAVEMGLRARRLKRQAAGAVFA
jgi:membrane protein CcdC involved in cytochrome C biogenesis